MKQNLACGNGPWSRHLVLRSLLGFLLATLGLVFAVTAVLLVEGRGEGMAPHLWRVLIGEAGKAAWVILVAGGALLTFVLRPISRTTIEKWLRRRSLSVSLADQAAAELRRVRIWRTVPTVLAAYVAVAPVLVAQLSLALRGSAYPFSEASNSRIYPSPIFLGYLSGTVLAEATRHRSLAKGTRGAVLDVRRPRSYLAFRARLLPIVGIDEAAPLKCVLR